jgi:hypothetical protein
VESRSQSFSVGLSLVLSLESTELLHGRQLGSKGQEELERGRRRHARGETAKKQKKKEKKRKKKKNGKTTSSLPSRHGDNHDQ